ncbi:PqqD family protein [Parablastomonas sp. CN1-191]|uniref:PqqD family protein n=1 Tax=Parablastomonas sp. CN1-191 TaxID=3400908 RepID=UPI003BF7EDC2
MTLEDRLDPSPDVVTRELETETVLLDMASGSYFGLDEIGGEVWQAVEEGQTLGQACDRLAARYDVERARLEADVLALAEAIVAKGLATTANAPA